MNPEFGPDGSGFRGFPEYPNPLEVGGACTESRAAFSEPMRLILLCIWAQSPVWCFCTHDNQQVQAGAGGGFGRSSAIRRKISSNICHGMATSASSGCRVQELPALPAKRARQRSRTECRGRRQARAVCYGRCPIPPHRDVIAAVRRQRPGEVPSPVPNRDGRRSSSASTDSLEAVRLRTGSAWRAAW